LRRRTPKRVVGVELEHLAQLAEQENSHARGLRLGGEAIADPDGELERSIPEAAGLLEGRLLDVLRRDHLGALAQVRELLAPRLPLHQLEADLGEARLLSSRFAPLLR